MVSPHAKVSRRGHTPNRAWAGHTVYENPGCEQEWNHKNDASDIFHHQHKIGAKSDARNCKKCENRLNCGAWPDKLGNSIANEADYHSNDK